MISEQLKRVNKEITKVRILLTNFHSVIITFLKNNFIRTQTFFQLRSL